MGNNCPYPKYHYPYPKPSSLCWTEYVGQCGDNRRTRINDVFKQHYKGVVVEWEGLPTSVSKSTVKFLMNPSEASVTNSEVTLNIPKNIPRSDLPNFVENVPIRFRGKLSSCGIFLFCVITWFLSYPYIGFLFQVVLQTMFSKL